MSNYKDIVGTAVRNNAGNIPTAETGQIFFDSTNIDFKYQKPNVTSAGAWRTGISINGMFGVVYKLKVNSVYGRALKKAKYLARVPSKNMKSIKFIGLDKNEFKKYKKEYQKLVG